MPAVIDTVRFLEWGKPSPAGSRFQGTITAKSVFGSDGWLDYTGRESATEEKTETEIECREDGFLGYGSREDAAEGSTMSSIGILTAERKAEFRKMCTDAFCEDGDLIWDVVISLDSYQLAQKNGLNTQADYGAAIAKILPAFFKSVGLNPDNMYWWENYHNNKDHPHMHVCFLEKVNTRNKGCFTQKQLDRLKRIIIKELTARESLREKTGLSSEQFLQNTQYSKEALVEEFRKKDYQGIQTLQDLRKVLPKKGRFSYGSYALLPYRNQIDQIIDEMLQSEELKPAYEKYLGMLNMLAAVMTENAGKDLQTIRETELRKMHREIGNIILTSLKKDHRDHSDSRVRKEDLEAQYEQKEQEYSNAVPEQEKSGFQKGAELYREARTYTDVKQQAGHLRTAYEYYQKLLTKYPDNPYIHHRLAWMNYYGEGVPKNNAEAKYHVIQAVRNHSQCDFVLYSRICFAQKQYREGLDALKLGELNHDPASTYLLGMDQISGRHCHKDKNQGMILVQEASALGSGHAKTYLEKHNTVKSGKGKMVPAGISSQALNYLNHRSAEIQSEIDAYLKEEKEIKI
jgi:hypothetical protein